MPPAYAFNWGELALAVKETAKWRCQNCGHPHDPNDGYTLTVHHIDCNPQNNKLWNLVALCQRCHLHYQRRQDRRQLSFFGMPTWLQTFFSAIPSKSSGIKN